MVNPSFRWSLGRRLAALAVGASLVTAAIGAAALLSNSRVAERMGVIQEQRLKPLVQIDRVGRAIERQRASVLSTLAATNDVMQEMLEKRVAGDQIEIPAALAALQARESDPTQKGLIAGLAASIAKSQGEGLSAVLDKLRKGQFVEADVASQSLYMPQIEAANAALDKVIRTEVALAERDYQASLASVDRQAGFTMAAILASLIVLLLFSAHIANALHRALGAHEGDLALAARQISRGNLDHRIRAREGDRESVAASLNSMAEHLSTLVGDVASSAHAVAGIAQRMSRSSDILSGRTSGQASSLEETAASMEQLATTVTRNSENADHARRLAEEASALAMEGGEAMREVETTMHTIIDSSMRVAEIASVMDDIAFQTNILALNAAVEAARAGAEGRGFAVVAAEVRSLSQRSAEAAREIRALVDESAARTRVGGRHVADAGATMKQIIEASRGVTDSVAEIAGASREQSAGIVQVNRAIDQIDKAVQENASLAEQTSRQARDISGEAQSLVASVSRFSAREAAMDTGEALLPALQPVKALLSPGPA